MTNKQANLCKVISKYKNYETVLKKTGYEDEIDLQNALKSRLDFSDDESEFVLPDELLEEYESWKRKRNSSIRSVISIIISVVALFFSIRGDSVLWIFITNLLKCI